ncbi:MAG: glycosyltransferase family 2 protein, partial [Actinomycetes bacterium]
MSVSPLVSICIPTYNGERFIKETLASVVNQTHRNIEILVSDHSSSDSTRQIVESFRDERIRLSVLAPGGGAAANWNASVGSAKGQFVKLVCQDDILRPDCVDLQTKSLLQNPSASFSFSLRNIISPKGRTLIRSRGFSPDNNVVSLREGLDTLVRSGTNIFGEPCAVLM